MVTSKEKVGENGEKRYTGTPFPSCFSHFFAHFLFLPILIYTTSLITPHVSRRPQNNNKINKAKRVKCMLILLQIHLLSFIFRPSHLSLPPHTDGHAHTRTHLRVDVQVQAQEHSTGTQARMNMRKAKITR
mmetsp:Transcript_11258/g.29678  ORF Transcript_11258/g.29678 Transcript_11258/m.29678 type:complete len:131 (+) Transcript_11258:279-671(+)